MHKCLIYHLDMKPENVIICKDDIAKIIDFGFSRSATIQDKKKRYEADWSNLGTRGYISPLSWDWGAKIDSDERLAKRDSFAVGMALINGLLVPILELEDKAEDVKVNFGEGQQIVLKRIKSWQDTLAGINWKNPQYSGPELSGVARAAIGLIDDNPQTRWPVKQAAEALKADRKQLRQEHMSNRNNVLTALNDRNRKIGQLKKWGV